ncbi:DNA repair protein [Martiniozyma asiatica (nom. inval.)]|nr:DNA repair protein [Martiniozyma asiatica]
MNSNSISSNREKALKKIKERQALLKTGSQVKRANTEQPNTEGNKKPRPLSAQQRALIELNRQNALKRQLSRRDASNTDNIGNNLSPSTNTNANTSPKKKNLYIRPSIKKWDYIEYDLSTMKDSEGGYLLNDNNSTLGPAEFKGKTLDDWKQAQDEKALIDPQHPLIDTSQMPKCFECGSIELDKLLLNTFKAKVCKACRLKYPEKYSLLTKTECKDDYFLTEPELADLNLFHRLIKQNPHGTFSRMQLFLRFQIEEYAFNKWGGADKLDDEWLRREEMKKKRKEKKWNDKLLDMKRKLRAEEITKNLRVGEETKHVHEWCNPILRDENLWIKRCVLCGMEVEEIII